MNILIDTHALIWFITNDNKLSVKNKAFIEDLENIFFVSIASYWEIAIKYSLGRLELKDNLHHIFEIIENKSFNILPITKIHILQLASLEFHHQDPFDRLMIAQAIVEDLTILSKDQYFYKYDVKLLWN